MAMLRWSTQMRSWTRIIALSLVANLCSAGLPPGAIRAENAKGAESTAPTGTTPNRRSAVEVVFDCENCPQLFALVIQQHKGNNMIEVHADVPDRKEGTGG